MACCGRRGVEWVAEAPCAGVALECGQSTVEAALLVPILLGCILLLAQPCIYLYDRMVMQQAAAEACRLLSTLPEGDADAVEGLVRRRLAAVPQQDCFHVHDGSSCSWSIETQGGQASDKVTVAIENKIIPLPLLDFSCKAVGATDGNGCWTIRVEETMTTQPAWARSSSSGSDPSSWVGDWQ